MVRGGEENLFASAYWQSNFFIVWGLLFHRQNRWGTSMVYEGRSFPQHTSAWRNYYFLEFLDRKKSTRKSRSALPYEILQILSLMSQQRLVAMHRRPLVGSSLRIFPAAAPVVSKNIMGVASNLRRSAAFSANSADIITPHGGAPRNAVSRRTFINWEGYLTKFLRKDISDQLRDNTMTICLFAFLFLVFSGTGYF